MPPAHPERHHNTTSRKPTRNNTKGNDLNKSPHNPGLDYHPPAPPLPCTRRCAHAQGPGLVACVRTRPGPSRVNDPDYSRKFMPKSMAPSASRKSSDTEPSLKSASE